MCADGRNTTKKEWTQHVRTRRMAMVCAQLKHVHAALAPLLHIDWTLSSTDMLLQRQATALHHVFVAQRQVLNVVSACYIA